MENTTHVLQFDDGISIWTINNKYAHSYIAAMIFIGITILVGLPGNGLVLYVYHFVFRSTTANMCIQYLALMDIVIMCVGGPVELLHMRFPVMYGSVVKCSVMRTIELNAGLSSGLALFCITYDRYNHVCKPLKVFTARTMKRLIFGTAIISTVLTAPLFVIFGPQSVTHGSIVTKRCSFDDRVKNTEYPFAYFTFMAVIFVTGLSVTIVLDVMIVVAIRVWQRKGIGEQVPVSNIAVIGPGTDLPMVQEPTTQTSQRRRKTRTTYILCLVSTVSVLSHMPYIATGIFVNSELVAREKLSFLARQFWEVASKSYFISSAVNPLIYAGLNPGFRRECLNLFTNIGMNSRH